MIKYLVSILLIVGSLAYWMLATESGLQFSWRIGSPFIPGTINIQALHGNLLHGISWSSLYYQHNDMTITSKNAAFHWKPTQLFKMFNYFDIEYANIEHIVINKNNVFNYQITQFTIASSKKDTHDILLKTKQGNVWGEYSFGVSPQINIKMNLANLRYDNIDLKRLIGSIHYDVRQNNKISSQLTLTKLTTSGYLLPQITIRTTGAINQNKVSIQSIIDGGQIKPLLAKIHQIQIIQGNLRGKMSILGSIDHPIIQTQVNLANGKFTIPSNNVTISSLAVSAKSISNQQFDINGSFASGKGKGTITGNIKFDKNTFSSALRLQGNQLQVYNTNEYKIDASPDLRFSYQENKIRLTGNILIPYGNISSRDGSGTLSLPSDVVIVNRQQPTTEFSILNHLNLSVRLLLSDNITVKYENFQGRITGNLLITQQPGSNLNASGQFVVMKGTYRAYGKALKIKNGRLIYTNTPLTNPGLDIRAVTTVKTVAYQGETNFGDSDFQPSYSGTSTITVGVIARGTLQKPIITLFSSPPDLSQGDILSYLLFGYPQSQLTGASSLSLLNIANSMYGGANPANITQRIKNELGFDEFDVGSTEYYSQTTGSSQQATTVNIGKHLAPNLSVHYSVGMFQSVSILSLRYKISKYLAIQSETSTLENGGDLLYQVQSND